MVYENTINNEQWQPHFIKHTKSKVSILSIKTQGDKMTCFLRLLTFCCVLPDTVYLCPSSDQRLRPSCDGCGVCFTHFHPFLFPCRAVGIFPMSPDLSRGGQIARMHPLWHPAAKTTPGPTTKPHRVDSYRKGRMFLQRFCESNCSLSCDAYYNPSKLIFIRSFKRVKMNSS